MKIAVIPARGGSKRIPRKNIKPFFGKPIIAWSIEAAQESNCFDHIIVSTDDDEIADVAKHYGAEVPFKRPLELSNDYAGTIPVIAHAIEWHHQRGKAIEYACCIYATAPFILAKDLEQGIKILESTDAEYSFAVTSYPFPIQRAIRITKMQRVEMLQPKYFDTRSQDLEKTWHDAGQFYWGKSEAWLSNKIFFEQHAVPIILPRHRVQDIDTFEDWKRAEFMFEALKKS